MVSERDPLAVAVKKAFRGVEAIGAEFVIALCFVGHSPLQSFFRVFLQLPNDGEPAKAACSIPERRLAGLVNRSGYRPEGIK